MTAQMHDQFDYGAETYDLVGGDGRGLFQPREYGLRPYGRSTACERGFVCSYKLSDGRLILSGLSLSCSGEPPAAFGVRPAVDDRLGYTYRRIGHFVAFSGRILIATDFIPELYVHMGFQSACKYQTVRELAFDEGRLILDTDRSEESAAQRQRMAGHSDGPTSGVDLEEWIGRSFSLDFWR